MNIPPVSQEYDALLAQFVESSKRFKATLLHNVGEHLIAVQARHGETLAQYKRAYADYKAWEHFVAQRPQAADQCFNAIPDSAVRLGYERGRLRCSALMVNRLARLERTVRQDFPADAELERTVILYGSLLAAQTAAR